MSIAPAWTQCLAFFGTPRVFEPSPSQLSGDAGLLLIRQFDQCIGLTRAFAEALDAPRDSDLTEHTFLEMVRSRVYGIVAGYEDQDAEERIISEPMPLNRRARRTGRTGSQATRNLMLMGIDRGQTRISRIGSPPCATGTARPARSAMGVSGSMPRQW